MNGTLYIGVTSNLINRVYQHKNKIIKGFTEKYDLDRLVYYEVIQGSLEAMTREKQLKKYKRAWKINLIKDFNPSWDDLYFKILNG
jgi:putative endonuclease